MYMYIPLASIVLTRVFISEFMAIGGMAMPDASIKMRGLTCAKSGLLNLSLSTIGSPAVVLCRVCSTMLFRVPSQTTSNLVVATSKPLKFWAPVSPLIVTCPEIQYRDIRIRKGERKRKRKGERGSERECGCCKCIKTRHDCFMCHDCFNTTHSYV